MQQPYKFSSTAKENQPSNEIWDMCLKGNLSREDKDRLFNNIYQNSGSGNYNYNYKLGGWIFPLKQFLKCYLVKYNYNNNIWNEIWAFDKTCIRNCIYTKSNILEIFEKPKI